MTPRQTITDRQIRELRMAAVRGNAPDIVSTCTRALWKPMSASDRQFLLEPYRTEALKAEEVRLACRERCARILFNLTGAKP